LLANPKLDFRACLGAVTAHPDGTVALSSQLAEALALGVGDNLNYSPAR